jgi:hypothetical protein
VDLKPYTLKHPVTVGSETITELKFRRPQAGDLRSFPLQNQAGGDLLNVAGKMCGQPQPVMDKLDVEDVLGITEVVVNFLPTGLLTGLKL